MGEEELAVFRAQLIDRRGRIETVRTSAGDSADLSRLLREVDDALDRMDHGSYGCCTICHEPIERERLASDPLVSVCLDHLSAGQRRALEQDLELASEIQTGLLPKRDLSTDSWIAHYDYRPAGAVSGDFCDFMRCDDGRLFFIAGDASGKGVAASLLMSHLHATFRTLLSLGTPLIELMKRANRLFCGSTMPAHYATAVCGFAGLSGEIEIINAGHCPPMIVRRHGVETVAASGLPLGLFCEGDYSACRFRLEPGDSVLLYTDGLTEARDSLEAEYGTGRLAALLPQLHGLDARELAGACLDDLRRFLAGTRQQDDLTVMVVQRAGNRLQTM